ncbi:MAG: PHP domain-containing protein [Clostridia bacterium]|nr:PHP domain-containing protein [Clostridia bacterium]
MYIDKTGKKWYKVALHLHTTLSDGLLTPEEVAKKYAADGFDAIAITDHWHFYPRNELSGIEIIAGCEYNMNNCGRDTIKGVMHIVGVGMKKEPVYKAGATRQQIIDAIIDVGGVAVLAHPAWSLNTMQDVKELKGFSMLEIYNGLSAEDGHSAYSGYIVDVLANEGIFFPLTATQDSHYYDERDGIPSYVMVNAESNSTKDILAAIAEKKFYATQGPELYVRREGANIIVDCSECVRMDFISNSSGGNKIVKGEGITHAECKINEWEKWMRVEAFDKDGKCAWSNYIVL